MTQGGGTRQRSGIGHGKDIVEPFKAHHADLALFSARLALDRAIVAP
jgi:hypothetical protein